MSVGILDFEIKNYSAINEGRNPVILPLKQSDGSIMNVKLVTGKSVSLENQEQVDITERFPYVKIVEFEKPSIPIKVKHEKLKYKIGSDLRRGRPTKTGRSNQ